MPEVSIIIPCHNHAHYLPMAVNSVLAQTFPDWEAIIVDDGSTDDTAAVAAQVTDPRVRYLYQENRGLSAARNTGIRAAQGQYLAFLDSDDEWEPRFLEACKALLAASETIAAVVTLARFIDENGAALPRLGGQVLRPEGFRSRLIEGGFFPVHAVLVRAKAVRRAGLFDETLTSAEDWDLWLRITAEDGVMLSIPEPLARYRVSVGSMSTNATRMHANRIAVLTKHFSPPQGDPLTWPAGKRRGYAFAYRTAALGYIAQQEADEGWRYLAQAVELEPGLLRRLDTFYEVILGDQPRGYRGAAGLLDISVNGAETLRRLGLLFASASPSVQALKGTAYGNAYLALAMLSDQAGDWAAARRYLQLGIRSYPPLLRDRTVVRRLAKVSVGKRAVSFLKRLPVPKTSLQCDPSTAVTRKERN
jgi:glycosyltransferase involved in cell wall biosynthesis